MSEFDPIDLFYLQSIDTWVKKQMSPENVHVKVECNIHRVKCMTCGKKMTVSEEDSPPSSPERDDPPYATAGLSDTTPIKLKLQEQTVTPSIPQGK